MPKVFFIDTGLLSHLLGVGSADLLEQPAGVSDAVSAWSGERARRLIARQRWREPS